MQDVSPSDWHMFLHEPPDQETAAEVARAKRPCLKAPANRNPEWDALTGSDGRRLDRESSEDLVDNMCLAGKFKRVMAESWRRLTGRPARTYVMEFLVATCPEHANALMEYAKEIKLAGYDHWSSFDANGWEPFELPRNAQGWGRVVTDDEQLSDWYAERMYSLPIPHYAGDGWVCRAQHWPAFDYPDANEHGPYGSSGPRWSSVA